jgi:hypothetical protein
LSTGASIQFSKEYPIPEDLLKNLRYEYLRRELWVPLEIRGGKIVFIVDNHNNIIKRDMIENILKTKSVEYISATKQDICKFIECFYDVGDPEDKDDAIDGETKKEAADEKWGLELSVLSETRDAFKDLKW